MATAFDFGNMFGGMGGTPTGLDALLSEDQRKLMGRNAALAAAAALLQASGRSTTPIGLGQALGSALQAGQQGYTQARAGSLQDLVLNQKLQEAKRDEEFNKLIRDQLYPKADAGVVPQTPGLIAAIGAPIETAGPYGPTLARQALIPAPDMAAAQPAPAALGGMFTNLNPLQRAIVAGNPKAMLPKVFEESLKNDSFRTMTQDEKVAMGLNPKGVYQLNTRTGEPKLVQGSDSFRTMTKDEIVAMGLDPRSVYQMNTITGKPELIRGYEGAFGGGLQGGAYDTLLNEDPSTAKYALAYRILNQPVPVEKVQPDGSVKVVYEQPMPIPSSFPKPTYAGKLPAKPVGAPLAAGAPMPAPAVVGAPVRPPVAGGAPIDTQLGGMTGTGAKSTPYAPTSGQIGEARKQALTIDKLVGSLNALEANVKQEGMQIGGMGKAGGKQEALFQDTILQLKELQNLGVLNGPDERILLQQLANPTQLSAYLKGYGGPDYVLSKITELKNKAERELSMINRQFPAPVTNRPVAPPAPQLYTPPSSIGDILKRYPGAGG
jgi:hypothetical protein